MSNLAIKALNAAPIMIFKRNFTPVVTIAPKKKLKAQIELSYNRRRPGGVYGDMPPRPILPGEEPQRTTTVGEYRKWAKVPPNSEPPVGVPAAKLAHKMKLEAGKTYRWCVCGFSKNQPLCDFKHLLLDGKGFNKSNKVEYRPIEFTVSETKEYYLCQCKKSSNRPFCDGTHRSLWDEKDALVIVE